MARKSKTGPGTTVASEQPAAAATLAAAAAATPDRKRKSTKRAVRRGTAAAAVADAEIAADSDGERCEAAAAAAAYRVVSEDATAGTGTGADDALKGRAMDAASDEDDDAPEAVSFAKSKSQAVTDARVARDSVSQQKKAQKALRRGRDEKYKEQKKRKWEAVKAPRLPDDVLNFLDSAAAAASSSVTLKAERKERGAGAAAAALESVSADCCEVKCNDGGDEATANASTDPAGRGDGSDDEPAAGGGGFIPLSPTAGTLANKRYKVSVVKEVKAVPDSKAAQFIDRFRSGGSRVQRESYSSVIRKREKRRVRLC